MRDLNLRLGQRLRELRRTRHLTQEQLAERSGMSYKFIGEIERGQGNPTVATLAALGVALDVDIVELFGPLASAQEAEVTYLLSSTDLHAVREALTTVESVIKRVSTPTRRTARRKRARRT